jgi:molybdopterin-guanine dinucleotide biosynthesis protein A
MRGQPQVSGIVLAGGLSRRLGRDKAVERLGDRPLIGRTIDRLSQVTDDIVVVVSNEERASVLPLPAGTKVTVDIYPETGSLGGIFSGVSAAEGEWGMVVACDMPFINTCLVRHMLSLKEGFDVVVPEVKGRPEPTHAAYSKACLPHIERLIGSGDLKIVRFFDDVRVRTVPENDLERLDPGQLSLFNINDQRDLDRALELVAQGR